jgi:hypothetical protein
VLAARQPTLLSIDGCDDAKCHAGIRAGWLMVQALRVRAEERLLMQDTRYAAYAAQVRYWLIPGWW